MSEREIEINCSSCESVYIIICDQTYDPPISCAFCCHQLEQSFDAEDDNEIEKPNDDETD